MAEYEIEIIDYLKLIWRKKWLIIIGTFVFVAVTGAVTFLLPKTFVATAYLRIGKIGGRLIEEPLALRARIEAAHYAERFIENEELSILADDLRLKTESSRVGVIRVTAEGPYRESNGKFLRYVVSDATSMHEQQYADAVQIKKEREKFLISQISHLENRIAHITDTIKDPEVRMRR
ncbi:MAG: Wzz/FepE/Etk N-terminal domain-containing protein, partial [Candidatus Aminicenantes bacterium]